MSQQNVEVVRELFEAWDRRSSIGPEELAELLGARLHEEFELHTLYLGHVYKGPGALLDFWVDAGETWDQYTLEPEEILDIGQHVLLMAHMSGRGVGSGVPIAQRIAVLWRFEGPMAIHAKTFLSKDEALEAAGLEE
jgi:ketosteroid isomerase-like protein